MRKITNKTIENYKHFLIIEEKTVATIEKYVHDVTAFAKWLGNRPADKSTTLAYKRYLCEQYATASINSMLSSLNTFFEYMDWYDCKVKTIKIQRQIFASKGKELTKAEYERLLMAAKNQDNKRLYYLIQTIAATGIRISELKYITCEAVKSGQADIHCKGKVRMVFLPKQLCKMLKAYIKECNIKSGSVFITKTGRPLDRSNVWSEMKKLCAAASVEPKKVFPHNLRHLFARTYYSLHKDIVRLADILGHSSVETTRIYTMESGDIHRKQLEKMGLLRWQTT